MLLDRRFSRAPILFVLVLAVIVGFEPPVLAAAPRSSARASSSDVQARPDAVSAKLAAKLAGHRIEITGDDTTTSTTYANPDGSLTTEQAAGPIRVQNADGSWSPLDLDLSQNSDGSWSPAATQATVDFSGGGNKSLASVSDSMGRGFGLGWGAKLPTPTVTGGTAIYQLDSTTQLVVASTALGFITHLVLSAPPKAAPTYKLPLTLKKLAAAKGSDGSLVVSDSSSGKTAWRSRPLVMWDSKADAAGDPTNVQQVDYTWPATARGTRSWTSRQR